MQNHFLAKKCEKSISSYPNTSRQPYVSLRLPHLASTASILAPDLTIEELGLSPRATLIVTTLNDDERNEILQQVCLFLHLPTYHHTPLSCCFIETNSCQ